MVAAMGLNAAGFLGREHLVSSAARNAGKRVNGAFSTSTPGMFPPNPRDV